MTFQASIPLASDLISVSQNDIKNNFTSLNTAWNVDHVGFNASGAGDHKQITLLAPISDPNKVAPITSVYSKTVGSRTELFYQNSNTASSVTPLSCMRAFGVFVPQVGPTLVDSFNIASVVRNSTGNYTISFTRALPTTNYAVIATGGMATNFATGCIIGTANYLVGSFTILLRSMTSIVGVDDGLPISFWVFQTGN